MKVSIVQPDLDIGNTYSFIFLTSLEELDVVSDQYSIDGQIEIKGSLIYTGRSHRVAGTVHFLKTFQCDRCLETFTQPQEFSFAEDFQKDGGDEPGRDMVSFSGDFIDIADLVRETIIVTQPLHHICGLDCRGLCMKCGANLNEAECGCDRHIIDPRLVALQKLFNKQ